MSAVGYPNVWVQAYCMCQWKFAPVSGCKRCGCELKDVFFVSGRLSCSSVEVWWEATVSPIGPLMGARCHWSQTGHAWCTNSTASAWGGEGGIEEKQRQTMSTSVVGRSLKIECFLASEASCSPCCSRVGWGAVWDPLRSLCKSPPNRKRRPSGRCSPSCHNPVKPEEMHWKTRRILSP